MGNFIKLKPKIKMSKYTIIAIIAMLSVASSAPVASS